ncbi:hypothetical protein NL676_023391 [Syzygium grande]|nr:hypothetical protein NL676_023391 [Syzygium grande]
MDRLVKPDVTEVELTFKKGQKCTKTFRVTNLMHTMSVAISLSTTNTSLFSFNQPYSIIPPLSSASYTLVSAPSDGPALSSPPDFITVRSSMLPTGKARQDDLRRLFSRPGPHVFKDATMPIAFVGLQVIEFLIKQNSQIRETESLLKKAIPGCDKSQLTKLLKYAIACGDAGIVASLIDGGADVNDVNPDGTSLISLAIEAGNLEILKILIASGTSVSKKNKHADHILHKAAEMNRVDLMEVLFKAFKDIIDLNKPNPDGRSPLHVAAANGFVDTIRFCVAVGADADATDSAGSTPLHLAAAKGHAEAVEYLVNRSTYARHVVDGDGKTAFELAAENGHSRLLDSLRLRDVLLRAARVDDVHGMKNCLAEGADVDARDQNGWTPLHRAAFKGRVESVKVLLSHGASVNAVDDAGYTPLQCAVEAGHGHLAPLLIAHGAKASPRGPKGAAPLGSDAAKHRLDHPCFLYPLCREKGRA